MKLINVAPDVWINPQKVAVIANYPAGDPHTLILFGTQSVEIAGQVSEVARLINQALDAEEPQ